MKRSYERGYKNLSILSDKHILITGGTGHIGAYLVRRLAAEPAHLLVVARNREKLEELKRANPTGDIATFQCDLTEPQDVLKVKEDIGNVDFLVHLASFVPKISAIQDEAYSSVRHNIAATVNLLDHFGPTSRKICLVSTAEVYGVPRFSPITEDHIAEPLSYYGIGKMAAEHYGRVFSQKKGCPVVILRLASVYGPGEVIQRAISNFIKTTLQGSSPVIFGDGSDLRDFVYIDDAVEAIVLALQKEKAGCNTYNIASGKGYSIKEIAETIVKLCGATSPPVYQPAQKRAMDYLFDISAAQKDLGYSPKTSLREGLEREIAWFKSQTE